MATVCLQITLESGSGELVTIASVRQRAVLLHAASVALEEAEELATRVAAEDGLLGELQRDEAGRLRRALELILPELRAAGAVQ